MGWIKLHAVCYIKHLGLNQYLNASVLRPILLYIVRDETLLSVSHQSTSTDFTTAETGLTHCTVNNSPDYQPNTHSNTTLRLFRAGSRCQLYELINTVLEGRAIRRIVRRRKNSQKKAGTSTLDLKTVKVFKYVTMIGLGGN